MKTFLSLLFVFLGAHTSWGALNSCVVIDTRSRIQSVWFCGMNPAFVVVRIELISSTLGVGPAQTHRFALRVCRRSVLPLCATSVLIAVHLKGVCAGCGKFSWTAIRKCLDTFSSKRSIWKLLLKKCRCMGHTRKTWAHTHTHFKSTHIPVSQKTEAKPQK